MNSYPLCSRLSFLNARITTDVKPNNQGLNTSLMKHHLAESWFSQKCKSWEPLKKFEPTHNCGHRPTFLWAHFLTEVPNSISGLFGFMPNWCCSLVSKWCLQSDTLPSMSAVPEVTPLSSRCGPGRGELGTHPLSHLLNPGLKMSYHELLRVSGQHPALLQTKDMSSTSSLGNSSSPVFFYLPAFISLPLNPSLFIY